MNPSGKLMSLAIQPKPIVAAGGVLGKDGWESTLLQIIFLINRDPRNEYTS